MLPRWILVPVLAAAALAQETPARLSERKFVLSGTVTDSAGGEVLPEIEVSIQRAQTDILLNTVVTGEDGRFEFRDLAPAKYALTARGRGYLTQGYQEHQGYWTGIVTGPGLESENLKFALKPESSISGTVTDEFNEPVAQGHVQLFTTGRPVAPQTIFPGREAITDDAGHYRFGHLGEGKYYVVVSAVPWYARTTRTRVSQQEDLETEEDSPRSENSASAPVEPERRSELDVAFQTTYYPNVTDPEQATPVVLKPGNRMTADFHLFAVPALRLRLRGAPPDPKNPAPAPILAERIFGQSRQVGSRGIDSDGTAEFTGLAPGRYALQLSAEGGGPPQERPVDLVADTEVAPGKGSELVSTVSGVVELEGVGPSDSKGYVLLMNLRSGESFGGVVSAKGEFKIEGGVRPARYEIGGAFNAADYTVKSVSAVGARIMGQQVEIGRGASVRLTVILTKGLGQVEGIALGEGKPQSQTMVVLVPNDPEHNLRLFHRDQSDSDGTFSLRQVLPGAYTLISIADGWDLEWTDPAVLKRYLAAGLKVRVEAGRKYQFKVEVQQREAASPMDHAPSVVKSSCAFDTFRQSR